MVLIGNKNFGVIWDLDNTLYKDHTPEMDEAYEVAGAQAALDCGAPLSFEDAKRFAHESYERGQAYLEAFVEKFAIDKNKYHQRYHELIDHTKIEIPSNIGELFQNLGISNHVLVTHGSRQWAERVIPYLGVEKWFPSDRIVTLEECGFEKKSASKLPFKRGIEILGLSADSIFVVEDSFANLSVPSQMGMRTIYLHYGKSISPKPDYINFEVASITEAFDCLTLEANTEP